MNENVLLVLCLLVLIKAESMLESNPLYNISELKPEAKETQNLDCCSAAAEHENSMPGYFAFLTVMAFHVFLQEKVDVGIIEIGIGGQYDSTNLILNPIACGDTSLGLDHTSILGNTVDKIAWHKAGILKPGVPAVTASQPEQAMNVLKERAKEIGCPLHVCPDIKEYDAHGRELDLGIKGEMQSVNASLALQLCHIWLGKVKRNHENDITETISCKGDADEMPKDYSFPLTEQMLQEQQQAPKEDAAYREIEYMKYKLQPIQEVAYRENEYMKHKLQPIQEAAYREIEYLMYKLKPIQEGV